MCCLPRRCVLLLFGYFREPKGQGRSNLPHTVGLVSRHRAHSLTGQLCADSDQLRMPDWQLAAAGAGQLQLTAAETLQQLEGVTSHTAARVLLAQLGCYTRLYRHQQPDRRVAWTDRSPGTD